MTTKTRRGDAHPKRRPYTEEAPPDDDQQSESLTGPDWRMNVYLVVESGHSARGAAESVEEQLRFGRRPRVKALTLGDLQAELTRFKMHSSRDDGRQTMLYQEAISYSTERGIISDEIMAKLIKQRLLFLKRESIHVRNTELSKAVQTDEETADATDTNVVIGGSGNGRVKGRGTARSGADLKGRANTRQPKSGTKRRMSDPPGGKAEADSVIVDWPRGGPQLYVVLFGFHDGSLPLSMVREGIPLTAIIKLSTARMLKPRPHSEEDEEFMLYEMQEHDGRIPKSMTRDSVDFHSIMIPPHDSDTSTFWAEFKLMLDQDDVSILLKDVALSEITVREGSTTSIQNDNLLDFIDLIYDMERFQQHHSLYISSMSVSSVEAVEQLVYLRNMTTYSKDVSSVPVENITVSFVLHCMLSQVEQMCAASLTTEVESAEIKNDSIHSNKCVNLTPEIIYQGDFLQIDAYFLPENGNTFYHNILSVLKSLLVLRLWKQYKPLEASERERYDFHIDRLHHYSGREGISKSALCRQLHIASLGRLRSSVLKQKCLNTKPYRPRYLFKRRHFPTKHSCAVGKVVSELVQEEFSSSEKDTVTDISDHAAKMETLRRIFDCTEISSLLGFLATAESSVTTVNAMEDHTVFEKLESNIMVQTLCKAFESHACMIQHYFKPSDVLLLYFFQGIATKHWISKMTTPVGFRDFHDFVLQEEWAWLEVEEERYWEEFMLDKATFTKFRSSELQKLLEEWKILCEERNLGRYNRETEYYPPLKTDGPVPRSSRYIVGYDITPLRMQAVGDITEFASPDGTKVYSELHGWIRDKVYLSTRISMCDHTLAFNTTVPVGGDKLLCRITSSTGVIVAFSADIFFGSLRQQSEIYLNRNSSHEMEATVTKSVNNNKKNIKSYAKKGNNMKNQKHTSNNKNTRTIPVDKNIFSKISNQWGKLKTGVSISCPSGLVVKSLSCDEENGTRYIKQYYLHGNINENYRCILTNGRVLRCFPNGTVEMLCPDGTMRLCEVISRVQESGNDRSKLVEGKEDCNTGEVGAANKCIESKDENSTCQPSKQWQVLVEVVTTIWGEKYRVREGVVVDRSHVLAKTAIDSRLGEMYLRREDCTSSLLKPDGELIVTFPDGTRITSSCAVEAEVVFCEWTDEDISKYRVKIDVEVNEEGKSTSRNTLRLDPDEAYESVVMLTRVEHPSYATVSFCGRRSRCIVALPGDIHVNFGADEDMSVIMSDGTTLAASSDSLTFSSYPCRGCVAESCAVVHLAPVDGEDQDGFCTTRDILGNMFAVRSNGSCLSRGMGGGAGIPGNGGISSENGKVCSHEMLQQNVRCFVLRRDFSGEEIMNEQVVKNHLHKVQKTEGSSVHRYKVPGRPSVEVLNTFEPYNRGEWTIPYEVARPLPQRLSWLDLKTLPLGSLPEWFHGERPPRREPCPSSVWPEDSNRLDHHPLLLASPPERLNGRDFPLEEPSAASAWPGDISMSKLQTLELGPVGMVCNMPTSHIVDIKPCSIPEDVHSKQVMILRSLVKAQPTEGGMFNMLRTALLSYNSAADMIVKQYSSYQHAQTPIDEEQFQAHMMAVAEDCSQSRHVSVNVQ